MDTLKYNLNLYDSLHGIKLLIPDPDDVKSDYEEKLKAFEKPVFPFWTRIWPAALAMSAYLMEESNWIANKHILELGAGIGLPSFTAARFAKSVIISDADVDAVELLKKNIATMNLSHASAVQTNWNNHPVPFTGINTLLLSDICYDPEQYDQLVRLILTYKDQGADILISAPQRISTASFHTLLGSWIKQAFIRTVNDVEVAFFIV